MSDFWTGFAKYQDLDNYQYCLRNNSVSLIDCQKKSLGRRCGRRFDPAKNLDMCYNMFFEDDSTNKYVSNWMKITSVNFPLRKLENISLYMLYAEYLILIKILPLDLEPIAYHYLRSRSWDGRPH